jgi:tryptophan synthase alpha chain
MPFLMAGDPDLGQTRAALLALEAAGADLIELGIPYSDPLADGPVIQAAASRALSAATTPGRVLEMLQSLQGELTIPVILFTYSNPLLNRGMDNFCRAAAAAGAAGLVVPDLPLEEAEKLSAIATAHGLDLVLLVATTTPSERMGRIAAASRGFTYLVSVTGVTGVRTSIEGRVAVDALPRHDEHPRLFEARCHRARQAPGIEARSTCFLGGSARQPNFIG